MRFATRAIHVGAEPDPAFGDVIAPIHLSTTFVQDRVGRPRGGFDYSRSGNPTRAAWERVVAALEGAAQAVAFASGLAAEDALLRVALRPGEGIVLSDDAYGGTHRLISQVLGPWGVKLAVADLTDLAAARRAIGQAKPKLVWVESPSNPLLRVADIAALAGLAGAAGARLVVDNTFATPALQQPLALGADAVVHSATKYLAGHSDVVGGVVATSHADLAEALRFQAGAAGAVPGPFDVFLAHRGVKTLALRMARHSASAAWLARRLAGRAGVARVRYPGLGRAGEASPPALAARQMSAFGGMIALELPGGAAQAARFAQATELFALAESLGGVESLIEVPAAMTHASVAGTPLAVPAGLIRISVGLEDPEDLWQDLAAALARSAAPGAAGGAAPGGAAWRSLAPGAGAAGGAAPGGAAADDGAAPGGG
ncbi:MAG: cystathionine gamma-synthase [Bifidobacteriaceae bacterium]|jgi:cystathionine gamma-synthase|nr:cystathionine gamma-synthase [Bifidobacteriaceae bacterium]